MSLNKCFLIGNVGKDADVRANDNGKWATFTLATTDRAYTTSKGVQVPERTTWHNIIVFGDGLINKLVRPYIHKGTKLYIEGKQSNRTYDKSDGTKGFASEVIVNDLQLLDSKPQQAEAPQPPAPAPYAPY